MRDYPEFIYNNELTDAGKKVVAFLSAGVTKQLALVEGQNLTSLNQMSGPFQDYYVHVMAMKTSTPAQWVKDRAYGVASIWEQIVMQEEAAAAAAQQTQQAQTVTDLAARFDKLEATLTAAIAAHFPPAPAAEETDTDDTPKKAARSKKSQPEAGEPPAGTDAEGDGEQAEA